MTDTVALEIPQARSSSVLSDRNMRWYLGGQVVSLTGTMLQSAVLALLIIDIVGKERAAFWTGLVWVFGLLPGVMLGPVAGVLLDRWHKRDVLVATGLIGALQAFALAALTYSGTATLMKINALALVMGFVNAIDGPGRNAIVKDAIADKSKVRQASKMFTSLYNLAQIAGPGFAGYLVLTFGYPTTFVINAVSFLALIVALAKMSMPRGETKRLGTETMWNEVRSGSVEAFSRKGIRLCIFMASGLCVFGYTYNILLAVITKYMLHGSPIDYSHLAATNGIGSFLGAMIAVASDKKVSHKLLVVAGTSLTGCALVGLSITTRIHLAAVCVFFAGFGFLASFSSFRSSIMHLATQERLGVVLGYTFSFFYGGIMVSAFVVGPLADRIGYAPVLEICGGALVIMAGATPFLPGIDEIK